MYTEFFLRNYYAGENLETFLSCYQVEGAQQTNQDSPINTAPTISCHVSNYPNCA